MLKCFSIATVVSESASLLRYTYIACLLLGLPTHRIGWSVLPYYFHFPVLARARLLFITVQRHSNQGGCVFRHTFHSRLCSYGTGYSTVLVFRVSVECLLMSFVFYNTISQFVRYFCSLTNLVFCRSPLWMNFWIKNLSVSTHKTTPTHEMDTRTCLRVSFE
jgi:hypothetical protein